MRKMTSIFLVLATLLMVPLNIFAADSEKTAFSDIKSTDYYAQAATVLEELEIIAGYPDGTYGAEKSVSRAEMAAIVCRMLDKEADAEKSKGKTAFDDVAADHWASGYINIASDLNIIKGDGDGKFRPEDDVKYEEAIKMIVCASGYAKDVRIDAEDWSRAYIEIAEKKGITSDLKGKKGEAATRGDIAVMSYNALATESEDSKIPATPIASVNGGEYKAAQKVKLTTATKDADIYYTTDGTTPTAKSTKYTKEISVSKTTALKAIAVKNGISSKNVLSVEYKIQKASSGGSSGGGGGSSSSSKKKLTGAELKANNAAVSTAKAGDILTLAITPSKATGTVVWTIGGNKIENATSTYTVTTMDMGKTIKAEFTGTGSYNGVVSAECEVEKAAQVSAKDIMTTEVGNNPVALTNAENTVFLDNEGNEVPIEESAEITLSIENSERSSEEVTEATDEAKEAFATNLEIEAESITDVTVTAVDVNLSVDDTPVHPVGDVTVTLSAKQLGVSEDADLSKYVFSAKHTNKNGVDETVDGTVVLIDNVQYVRFELNGLSTIWVGNIPPKTVRFYNDKEDAEGKENCMGTVTVKFGDVMNPEDIPSPSRSGYLFCGWNYDVTSTRIIIELYIYASWVECPPEYVDDKVTMLEGVVTDTFLSHETIDKDNEYIEITVNAVNGMTFKELEASGIYYSLDDTDRTYTIAADGTGAEDYIGYSVIAYVKNFDEGTDKLVAIAPNANKNNTLEVTFDSFAEDGVDKKADYVSFEYYANINDYDTTIGKVSLKNDYVKYYYNGIYDDDLDANEVINLLEYCYEWSYNDEGAIKFVDNDGDGYYDYIFEETVDDECVVKTIISDEFKIKDRISGRTFTLNPNADEAYVIFYKNGARALFSDIAKGDVLSIVYNDDTLAASTVVKVYISSDKVEGFVVTASASKNKYKIGETIYAKSAVNYDDIHRSDNATFYLNHRGRIAYMKSKDSTDGNYGFLLAVNTEEDFSEGIRYTLRFMNKEGEWIDAKLYEKLAIYDAYGVQMKKYKDTDALEEGIARDTDNWLAISPDGELILDGAKNQRIFKYALNSEGEITVIKLPYSLLSEDKFSYDEFSGAEYNKTQNEFDGIEYEGGVDEDTIVFAVDSNDVKDVTKKKEVALLTSALFEDEGEYEGFAYDYDDGTYKCMVITGAELEVDEGGSDDDGSEVGVEATDGNYGFLLSVNTEEGFSEGYTLRFMNKEGEWVDARLNGKLAIYNSDGEQVVRFKDAYDVYENIELYTDGWLIYGGNFNKSERIFKYALNSEDEITAIRRLEYDDSFEGTTISGGVDENTIVFAVDSDDIEDVTKKKEVALLTSAFFEDEGEYEGLAYDIEDGTYKCMVIPGVELEDGEGGSDDDGSDEGTEPTDGSYGFLLAASTGTDFEGCKFELRFMNEKGEWVDAKLYEKLAIYDSNGTRIVRYKDTDELEEGIAKDTDNWLAIDNDGELILDGALKQRVFKYALNSDGCITAVTLPENGLEEDVFSYDEFLGENRAVYVESSNRFKNISYKGGVDDDTVVFKIDVVGNDITAVTKKKEVALVTSALFRDECEYEGFAYEYDSEDCNYKCMVITDAGNKIDEKDSLLIISYAELCSDGYDDFFEIKGYKDGKEVTLETVPEKDLEISDFEGNSYYIGDFENLSGGSIAEISIDWTGKVDCVRVLFETEDAEYGEGGVKSEGYFDEGAAYAYGSIVSKKAIGSGKVIDLAKEYVEDDTDVLAELVTAGGNMKGSIYLVEQGARKNAIKVDNVFIEDYVGLIDEFTEAGDDIYFAFAKLYDGDTIDIVIYEIEMPY